MIIKKCFKCLRKKSIELFYKHPATADGYLNKCKSCTKKDVRRRYFDPESRLKIAEYEKKRYQSAHRRAKFAQYQTTHRAKNKGKYKARGKVSNSLRSGNLTKLSCQVCGVEKVEAHHSDYRKPLNVTWLCREHHLESEGKRKLRN